jgi:hypothetical protein
MLVPATYPTDRLVAFDVGDNTMAQPLDVKRLLATGRQLTETGRTQAAQLGTDLVEQGRQATDQISAVIEQLVNPVGRGRDEDLRQTVRAEVTEQLRTVESKIKVHLAEGQLAADRIAELSKQRREHTEDLRDAVWVPNIRPGRLTCVFAEACVCRIAVRCSMKSVGGVL